MKEFNSYDEESKELFERMWQKHLENDEKNLGKSEGLDGEHAAEEHRITQELNEEWQKIADKWGVKLK